mmetsp:Transcript_20388/g.65166  ORF Transcript_20388/g.65166 Transcript_20388/m.65166 type:complete len:565 (+) Transcript_20388:209-1903(+)
MVATKPHAVPKSKGGIDAEDARRRREASTIQIRKDKKEEGLQKRRRPAAAAAAAPYGGSSSSSQPPQQARTATRSAEAPEPGLADTLKSLPEDVQLLNSDDRGQQLEACIRLRKLLSIERNPPIAEIIEAGVVPRLVQFLHCFDDPMLAFEAAWAVTNVASGTSEHTRVLLDNGAVPVLVQLALHEDSNLREQSMWALGNIAGDSPRCRDLVLSYGVVPRLLPQCESCEQPRAGPSAGPSHLSSHPHVYQPPPGGQAHLVTQPLLSAAPTMQRNATWLLSNLCRGKPPPRWALVEPTVPVLVRLLQRQTDDEVLTDACWAISYLSEPPERIAPLVEAGAILPLVALLSHAMPSVQTPALRAVGNIAAGTAAQAAALIAGGALGPLQRLLSTGKKELRKEAAWMLSNLTAGDREQVAAVCAAGVVPKLLDMAAHEEYEIKKEVVYALCNACCFGSAQIACGLAQLGIVVRLCDLLELPDASLLLAVLEALEALLRAGGDGVGLNPHARLVDEAGGCEKIEALQMHENPEVFEKAQALLEAFFGADEDEEDPLTAPLATAEGFSFG